MDTSKVKQLLETAEINTLRKIAGKIRLDCVTNQDIRQQCGIHPILERILKRREE
jgi:hypothetical protein